MLANFGIGTLDWADVTNSERTLAKRSEIETALRRLAPRMPPHEFGAVVDHALDSRGLKASALEAAATKGLGPSHSY